MKCLHDDVVFFKQKTAYEMRISDWSSDVCSSDLRLRHSRARTSRACLIRLPPDRPAWSPAGRSLLSLAAIDWGGECHMEGAHDHEESLVATDLYDLTVPVFIRGLRNLSAILEKGAAYAEEKGIDPLTLTQARLTQDMAPLAAQVQYASDSAKGAVIRIGGLDPVPMPDTEQSFADLQERIGKTVAFLESVPRDRSEE